LLNCAAKVAQFFESASILHKKTGKNFI